MEKLQVGIDGRTQRSIKTRQKLLKASEEIFLEHGFQKATISQIIKKAKTGYGTAYVYFNGKDELLIVLMEEIMNSFYEIAKIKFEPSSKEDAIKTIQYQTTTFLENGLKQKDILRVFGEAIRFSDKVAEKWEEIRTSFIEHIIEDVTYSQKNGFAREDLDKELVARHWFSLNETHLWDIVNGTIKHSIDEIVYNIVGIYVGGLYLHD